MPLNIIQGDITTLKVDAIVNAANEDLAMGGGVCGAIFTAAGKEEMKTACAGLGPCKVGHAVMTPGFRLPAKHVIHAVGPIWRGGKHQEEELLRQAYLSSLQLAEGAGLASVAFPLISSGIYGYPKDEALLVAVTAIGDFLKESEMQVTLVIYDRKSFSLEPTMVYTLQTYLKKHFTEDSDIPLYAQLESYRLRQSLAAESLVLPLEDRLHQLEETFSQTLLRLIDEKGLSDTTAYKRANIDRKLFSKIRSDIHYKPKKSTALAFAIALGMDPEEADDFLMTAGYRLSPSSKSDVLIRFFLEQGNPDIHAINEALFYYHLPLLGA